MEHWNNVVNNLIFIYLSVPSMFHLCSIYVPGGTKTGFLEHKWNINGFILI